MNKYADNFHIPRKQNCFAINGKIDSHFFRASSEVELERWMSSISSAIEDMEVHETREAGKIGIQGTTELSDDESDEEVEEGMCEKYLSFI